MHQEELGAFDLEAYGFRDPQEAFEALYNAGFSASHEREATGAQTQAEYFLNERAIGRLPADTREPTREQDAVELFLRSEILGESAHDVFLEHFERNTFYAQIFGEAPAPVVMDVEEVDYIPPEDEMAPRVHRVGAAFEGVMAIEEYEDAQIYVPTSSFCFLRAADKYFELRGWPVRLNRTGRAPNMTIEGFRLAVKEAKLEMKQLPRIFKAVRKDGVWGFQKLVKTGDTSKITSFAFLLFPVSYGTNTGRAENCYYHACLLKNPPLRQSPEGLVISPASIPFEELKQKIRQSRRTIMDPVSYQIPRAGPKAYTDIVYAYDYETSTADRFVQDIEGVGVMRVPLVGEGSVITTESPRVKFYGPTATNEMIAWLINDARSVGLRDIQLFAHNGGRFDTLLLLGSATEVTWQKQLSAGGCLKQLKGVSKIDKSMSLTVKDSCCFTVMSLKAIGDTFNCAIQKGECAIGGRNHQWFVDHEAEWKPYMDQDVLALACVLVTLEGHLRTLGQSITTSCGISSIAWNLLQHNSAPEYSKIEVTRCPVMQQFHNEASYGGRIIHWRREFVAGETEFICPKRGRYKSKGLICYDANSLYPYCMFDFDYPYGKPLVVQASEAPEQRRAQFDWAILQGHLFIAEVTFDTGNQRYPLLPHRTRGGSVSYPCGVFTGVYTSVDIQEAMSQGYKVTAVGAMTIWTKKCNMFRMLIEKLYKWRQQLKKEGNSLEYIIKIILNSMYGKFRELIDSMTSFAANPGVRGQKVMSTMELPTGQTRRQYRIINPKSKKPTYIAAFILSYSKMHMNRLIRKLGPENIVYGDTDSIYATVEAGMDIKEGPELGAFKNDYEEGTHIKEAIFLDLKRYFISFNRPVACGLSNAEKREKASYKAEGKHWTKQKYDTYKAKFNGLSFRRDNVVADFLEERKEQGAETKEAKMRLLYREFLTTPKITIECAVDRWIRKGCQVFIKADQRSSFSVAPEKRAQWVGTEFYPPGFPLGEAASPAFAFPAVQPARTPAAPYVWQSKRLFSMHPPAVEGKIRLANTKTMEEELAACSITGFALKDNKILMRIKDQWYRHTAYGPKVGVPNSKLPIGSRAILSVPPVAAPLASLLTAKQIEEYYTSFINTLQSQKEAILKNWTQGGGYIAPAATPEAPEDFEYFEE